MSSTQVPDPVIVQVRELLSQGKAMVAVARLETVCNSTNTNPEHWFLYGAAQAEAGQFIGAAEAFERTIKILPSHLAALTNLGRVYNSLKNHQQAIAPLKQALTLNPSYHPAAIQLVTAFIALQKLEEAEKISSMLHKAEPLNVESLLLLGMIRKFQNKYDDAIIYYDKALSIQPDAISVLINKGLVLQAMGKVDDAIKLFQTVTKQAPTLAQIWHILAMAWLAKADLKQAIPCFEKAFELNPIDVELGVQLAKAYRHVGRTSECETVCKKVLETDPDNAEALFFQNAYSKQASHETLDRIPAEVTRQMYKGKSEMPSSLGKSFNDSLTTTLEYKAPEVLNMAVRDQFGTVSKKIDVLELGCGSGLCGSKFSDIANLLIGTDISPDMLAGAKEKNAYSELYDADLIDALDNYESTFDLIIAMDVLCFFGDLTDIFNRCKRALKEHGIFGFSVVKPKSDAVFELQTYGHFVHSLVHLEQVAESTGFKQVFVEELPLRREMNEDQYGYVCLYQRT